MLCSPELLHQIGAVRLDRRHAQLENIRYFLVRSTFSQQLQHFLLAVGQKPIRILLTALLEMPHVVGQQQSGYRRAEVRLSLANRPQGRDEILFGRLLQKIPACAGRKRAQHVRFVGVHLTKITLSWG